VPDTLYDQDILAWSEQQANLIRRLAASDQLGNGIDWSNVAEEIEAVGRTELRTCETLLRQAMTHLLKLRVWPDSRFAAEWREEAAICLDDAQNRFSLSMRQKIDLEKLYARVVQRTIAVADDMSLSNLAAARCPFELDQLLDGNIKTLIARLGT